MANDVVDRFVESTHHLRRLLSIHLRDGIELLGKVNVPSDRLAVVNGGLRPLLRLDPLVSRGP